VPSPLLAGVVPPVVTPFREDGALDRDAFDANLEAYAGEDLRGVLVLGSNGEAASLTDEEKRTLVGAARRRLPGKVLLAGTGLESTRATVELTRAVADLGADGVVVVPPFYYKAQMTPDALRRHYETLADASPVPVVLYSVPQFTGLPIAAPLALDLARHPRIAGIKESAGDVGTVARIASSAPAHFAVTCGNAPVLYPSLCVGAVGGVLAVANCAPAPTAALYRAFLAGDHERARRLQKVVSALATAVTVTWGVAGLKLAMDVAGVRGGSVRAPLLPALPGAREELARLLAAAKDAL
jgi:4-hydroxy-2-oxoglutarate aldolase